VKGRSSTKLEIPAVVSSDIFCSSGFRSYAPHLNQRLNTYHAIIITFIHSLSLVFLMCDMSFTINYVIITLAIPIYGSSGYVMKFAVS